MLRFRRKGEEYFCEADLDEQTYSGLIKVCAEELGIEPHSILNIIKLPDVLIRNNRDVERLPNESKLEVII